MRLKPRCPQFPCHIVSSVARLASFLRSWAATSMSLRLGKVLGRRSGPSWDQLTRICRGWRGARRQGRDGCGQQGCHLPSGRPTRTRQRRAWARLTVAGQRGGPAQGAEGTEACTSGSSQWGGRDWKAQGPHVPQTSGQTSNRTPLAWPPLGLLTADLELPGEWVHLSAGSALLRVSALGLTSCVQATAEGHTEKQRHRDTETQRHRGDTETQRSRDTETETHSCIYLLRLVGVCRPPAGVRA